MIPSVNQQNKQLRLRYKEQEKKIAELETLIKRICDAFEFDLDNSKLTTKWNEKRLDWMLDSLSPLKDYLNSQIGNLLTIGISNQIIRKTQIVIMHLAVLNKHGLALPFESPSDKYSAIDAIEAKRKYQFEKKYPPCIICGEIRITNECHIIPHHMLGPNNPDNILWMCPLHHHLYDHSRLSKEEWDHLLSALEGKYGPAIEYVTKVQFRHQQIYWHELNEYGEPV